MFLLLFSAIIAPELLCPDRRDGVISLYLVRPITPTDYVAGRWLALLLVTLALVYSGQVMLLIGFTLAAAEPLTYLRENWLDVPRFIAGGFVIAVFTTTLPMAVSAFTTRRAYAAAFVIGLFVISAGVAGALTECKREVVETQRQIEGPSGRPEGQAVVFETRCEEPALGNAARWFALLTIGEVPIHVSDMFFAEEEVMRNDEQTARLARELPVIVPVGWYLLLVLGPGFALWWRYQRIRV